MLHGFHVCVCVCFFFARLTPAQNELYRRRIPIARRPSYLSEWSFLAGGDEFPSDQDHVLQPTGLPSTVWVYYFLCVSLVPTPVGSLTGSLCCIECACCRQVSIISRIRQPIFSHLVVGRVGPGTSTARRARSTSNVGNSKIDCTELRNSDQS